MAEKIFVKPKKGLKVHNEGGGFIDAEGQYVEKSIFIRRRINDGDLIISKPPKPDKPKD